MALGRTYSVALVGLNGYMVEVEADIGQPMSNKRHMQWTCANRASTGRPGGCCCWSARRCQSR